MLLSSEQVEEFKNKGFIVLKGFLDEAVMEGLSTYLDKLRDKQPAEGCGHDKPEGLFSVYMKGYKVEK